MKTGAQLETAHSQSAFESSFGKVFHSLLGTYLLDDRMDYSEVLPPDTYDPLLRRFALVAPLSSRPLATEWTVRALSDTPLLASSFSPSQIYEHHFSNDSDQNFETNLQTRTRYKPVDRK
ncbi:hypothetical protein H0H92_001654, partial [Tricholoma furcatifolium]